MPLLAWLRPPRPLLAMFLAVTLIPAAGLFWLGWRLLQQDRILLDQRTQERLERSADLLIAALEQKCLAVERELGDPAAAGRPVQGDDALRIACGPAGVAAYPATSLIYSPYLPPRYEVPDHWYRTGEDLEFRLRDYSGAIANLQETARSGDAAVRAGAQLRIARNLRKAGRLDAALAAYGELASLDSAYIGGIPAGLLARRARCALLAVLKRQRELEGEAQALYADLLGGRWQLIRAVFLLHAQDVRNWIQVDRQIEQRLIALAAGAEWLWENWQAAQRGEGRSSGRQSLAVDGRLVTVLWKVTKDRLDGWIAGPDYLGKYWLSGLRTTLEGRNTQLSLRDTDGRAVLGAPAAATAPHAQRAPADTGLPWTLSVASANPEADIDQLGARRSLLLAALGLVIVLVFAGSFFTARAFLRELATARLQSDFVAAVSHEFRTPLSSLRQLTQNLLDGRVAGDERRHSYYQALSRATDRLHRLVEGLLDFGRMEAGALRYRLEPLDVGELARSVTEEFRGQISDGSHQVELKTIGDRFPVRGDREALSRLLWNLLDNAVKYSPNSPIVWVEVGREADRIEVRVRDGGLGIAPEEQKEIYRKFFRGSAAKTAEVKGTGIGLAMVQHIVRAHGGEMRLESGHGAGSTFTVILPAQGEKQNHSQE